MQKSRIDILNGGSGKQIGNEKGEQKIIGRSHAKGGVDVKHASGEDYELEGGEVVDGDRVFSVKLKSQSGESFAAVAESLLKAKKKANSALKVASASNKDKIRKKIKAIEEELSALFAEQQEMNGDSTGEYAAVGTEMGAVTEEIQTPTETIEASAVEEIPATTEGMDVQAQQTDQGVNPDNPIARKLWGLLSASDKGATYKSYDEFLTNWDSNPRKTYEDVLSKSNKSNEIKGVVQFYHSYLLQPEMYFGSDQMKKKSADSSMKVGAITSSAPTKEINTGYTTVVTGGRASASSSVPERKFVETKDGLIIPKVTSEPIEVAKKKEVEPVGEVSKESEVLQQFENEKIKEIENDTYDAIFNKLKYTNLSDLFTSVDDVAKQFKEDPKGVLDAITSDNIAFSTIIPEIKRLFPGVIEDEGVQLVNTPYGVGNKPMVPLAKDYEKVDLDKFEGYRRRLERQAELDKIGVKNYVKPVNDQGFFESLGDALHRGSAVMAKSILETPAFVYNLAMYLPNKVNEAMGGDPNLFTAEKLGKTIGFDENKLADYYGENIKRSQERQQQKYDKDLVAYAKDGDWGNFFGLLSNSIMESAPVTISLMLGNAGGATTFGSIMAGGAVFGAGKYAELNEKEETAKLPEDVKLSNALSSGLFEGIFEQFGITKLGGAVSSLIKGKTREEALNLAKDSFLKVYGPVVGRYFGTVTEEGLSEAATTFAENAVDKYMGVDPNRDLMKDVVNSMIVGVGSAKVTSTPVTLLEVAVTSNARSKAKEIEQKKKSMNDSLRNPNVTEEAKRAISNAYLDLNQEESELYSQQKKEKESLPDEVKTQIYKNNQEVNGLEKALTDPNVNEETKVSLQERIDQLNKNTDELVAESKKQAEVTAAETTTPVAEVTPEVVAEAAPADLANEYIESIDKAKSESPETFWSVDRPFQKEDGTIDEEKLNKAAEDGRLIKTEAGFGVVGEDGDIKGVFKSNLESKEKTGDKVIQEAVKKGGIKLDNFALPNLMKIYERNGFREVSRLPFNKEFAPEGWTEAQGTPDVVAMVYDPEGKLDIEKKQFTDYGEAMAYRDSYVDQALSLKEEAAPAVEPIQLEKEVYTTEDINKLAAASDKIKNPIAKKIVTDAANVIKALKSLANTKVNIHTTRDSYNRSMDNNLTEEDAALGRGTTGYYIDSKGEIHISLPDIESNTIYHEGAHPVLNFLMKQDPAVVNRMSKQVESLGKSNKSVQEVVDWANEEYEVEVAKEEKIVEFIARVAEGRIDVTKLNKSAFEKVKNIINEMLGLLLGENAPVLSTVDEVISAAQTISEAFKTGRELQAQELETKQIAAAKRKKPAAPKKKERVVLEEVEDIKEMIDTKDNPKPVSKPKVSFKKNVKINAQAVRTKERAGKRVGRGLSIKTVGGQKVKEETDRLTIDYVKENAPEVFIKNANIIKDYPIVSGVSKFKEAKTVSDAQKIYDVFVKQVSDNLVYLIDSFKEEFREISTLWYDGANILANDLANKYGVSTEQVAGIIASLSPQKDWYQNVRLAELVLSAFKENPVLSDKMIKKQKQISDKGLKDYEKDVKKGKKTKEGLAKKKEDVKIILNELSKYVGKPLSEVPLEYKSFVIRLDNEVNGSKDYPILSPDGQILGTATTSQNENAKVAWGSYAEISKAVSIYLDGSQSNISSSLGDMHKIRNFYNNIIDPMSKDGDVTIDTHAVAAALLLPLSGNSKQVGQNFGTGTSNSGPFGIKGLYYAYSDAYALAAKETGLLPRQVQSITWEAVRGLFTDTFKRNKSEVKKINDIWQNYINKKIDINEARKQIAESAGGIKDPTWAESISRESLEDAKKADIGRRGRRDGQGAVGTEAGRVQGIEPAADKSTGVFKKPEKGVVLVPKKYKIDTDGEGNFLFYHYGKIKGDKIDPKYFGKNKYTSDQRRNGVSYFYTKSTDQESMVSGDVNVVKVPIEKVYPFNKDPLNFYDQAEANFRKDFPNGAFDATKQIDYMNPLIQAAGFDMTVAQWETFPLRAETTKALPIDKKLTNAYREFGGLDVADMRDKFEIDILNKLSDAAQKMTRKGEIIRDKFYGMGGTDASVKKLMKDKDLRATVGKSLFDKWNNTLPEKQKVRFKKPGERAVPKMEQSENMIGEKTGKWTLNNGFTIEESGLGSDKVFIIKQNGKKWATGLTLAQARSMVNNRARFKKPEKKYGDTIQRYMLDPNQPQMIRDIIENTSDLDFSGVKFPVINNLADRIIADALANNELDKLVTDLESVSSSKDVSGPLKVFILQKALEVAKVADMPSLAQKILIKLNEISSTAARTLRSLASNTIPESVMYSLRDRLNTARNKKLGKKKLEALENLYSEIQDILDSSIDESLNSAEIEALILKAINEGQVFPMTLEEFNNLKGEIASLKAQLQSAINNARATSPSNIYGVNLGSVQNNTVTNASTGQSRTVNDIMTELATKIMMRGNVTEKSFKQEVGVMLRKMGILATDAEVKGYYDSARNNPDVQEKLAQAGTAKGKARAQEISEKALKDLLSQVKARIAEYAKNHWNGNATQARNFKNEILEIFGPNSPIAQEIADKLEEVFNNKVKEAAEKVIQKELGSRKIPTPKQVKEAQSITQKILGHIYAGENAGVLDTDMFINLFADKYGFTGLTQEQMDVLKEFADVMAYTAPGSAERKKWMARMELYVKKITTPKWRFVLGVFAMENFYSAVLSGYTTFWRASTGVIYTSLGELAVEAMVQQIQNPKGLMGKNGLMSGLKKMLDGFKNQSWDQAKQYMKDGVPINNKFEAVQTGTIVEAYNSDKERESLKGKNIAAYIGSKVFRSIYWPVAMMARSIGAMDALITAPLREYYAKNAAMNELLREGMDQNDANFFKEMEKLLYRDEASVKQARQQAEEEYAALKALDPRLKKLGFRTSSNYINQRTYEILDSYRDAYIQEYSEDMQVRSRLMGTPTGTAGVLYESVTYLQRKFPGFTYIVPFARVPLNALNEWVSWSPYGLVRGVLGKGAISRTLRSTLESPVDHLKFGKTLWDVKGSPKEARENVRDLVKGVLGSAIMAIPLMIAMTAKTGDEEEEPERGGTPMKTWMDLPFRVTSDKPENVDYRYINELKERNLWFPNSFRIKIGKFDSGWIGYLDMPFAASLAPAGYIMDNKFITTKPKGERIFDDKGTMDQIAMGMMPYATFMKNQSFIKGVVDFATIFADERVPQEKGFSWAKTGAASLRFGTGIAKGLIYPNFYKQSYITYKSIAGEEQKLPYRMSEVDMDPARYINESMAYNFPFWEDVIENKAYDSFGLPVPYDIAYNRVGDAVLNNVMWNYVLPNTPIQWMRSFYASREGNAAWDFVIERQLEIPRIPGDGELSFDDNIKFKKLALGKFYEKFKWHMDNSYSDNTVELLKLKDYEAKKDIQDVMSVMAKIGMTYAKDQMLLDTAKTEEQRKLILNLLEYQTIQDLENGTVDRWLLYNPQINKLIMDSPTIERETKMETRPSRINE
jgi:hypothetical protein